MENFLIALGSVLVLVLALIRFSLWFARWQSWQKNRRAVRSNLESMAQEVRTRKLAQRQVDWLTKIQ